MEEEEKLSVNKLREEMDKVFKEANDIKYEVRFSPVGEDEIIEIAKEFAIRLDDFMHLAIGDDRDFYNDYRGWFESNHDEKVSYRSSMMFRDIEFSGLNSKRDKAMSYFNYLVKNLVMINHLIMAMEFNELHDECSIVKEL